MVGYNYRMPNLNAALGCAQMELLYQMLDNKRFISQKYEGFFEGLDVTLVNDNHYNQANFWLNAIIFEELDTRDEFLEFTNDNGIMTRPIWRLMNELPMYQSVLCDDLTNAKWLEERVVNIPSGVTKISGT